MDKDYRYTPKPAEIDSRQQIDPETPRGHERFFFGVTQKPFLRFFIPAALVVGALDIAGPLIFHKQFNLTLTLGLGAVVGLAATLRSRRP